MSKLKKTNISFSTVNESAIQIKVSKKEKKAKKKELQRTKKWKIDRRGRWTGSQLASLMSCAQGKGKGSWDNLDKVFSFGLTSIKYIYENAKERQTGRYVDDGDGSWDMQYGTKVEPLIRRITKEKLKEMKVEGKLKKVGFKKFDSMPNAGVSSDSIVVLNGKTEATVEMKACTRWTTHYDRTFKTTDEKSKDFWQICGQTIAHNVDTCYYVVAEPPEDKTKYLFHQGDIMELYEDFKKECKVSIEIVKASKPHQDALLKRLAIAEDALNDWLSDGGDLDTVLSECISFYEDNPEKLNKYIPPLPFAGEMNNETDVKIISKSKSKFIESLKKNIKKN
ncbi:exonuclease [Cellulophaga phage phi3ST:2]|nr:exonuclease [Cellulophaga phage phi3ST:2]